MKFNYISILMFIGVVAALASCEEVIQLELKNTQPVTVIEATLNATTGECKVEATHSAGFYDTNFTRIKGATVKLTTGSGMERILTEVGPGVYLARSLKPVPDEIFSLTLTDSAGNIFTATSSVPHPVFLDSLKVVRGFGDPRPDAEPIFLINPKWQDPPGVSNYYRFKVTKNGKLRQGSFNITSDEAFDGTEVDIPLYRYSFDLGDTVRLEFQTIDSVSHAYFSQVNDMARPSFVSATPYNPIGNFDNGALGYFGIYCSEIRDTIVSIRR